MHSCRRFLCLCPGRSNSKCHISAQWLEKQVYNSVRQRAVSLQVCCVTTGNALMAETLNQRRDDLNIFFSLLYLKGSRKFYCLTWNRVVRVIDFSKYQPNTMYRRISRLVHFQGTGDLYSQGSTKLFLLKDNGFNFCALPLGMRH